LALLCDQAHIRRNSVTSALGGLIKLAPTA